MLGAHLKRRYPMYLKRRYPMFGTIVLAVDGSKYSEKAVELAKHLAGAGNEEVVGRPRHRAAAGPLPDLPGPGLRGRPGDHRARQRVRGRAGEGRGHGPGRAAQRPLRRGRPRPDPTVPGPGTRPYPGWPPPAPCT